eukprot:gene2640-3057_t
MAYPQECKTSIDKKAGSPHATSYDSLGSFTLKEEDICEFIWQSCVDKEFIEFPSRIVKSIDEFSLSGNCVLAKIGNVTSEEPGPYNGRHFRLDPNAVVSESEAVSFYAEVNSLSKNDGKAHWVKAFSSVVQISARHCEGAKGFFIRITKDDIFTGIDIPLPGEAWGLNFVSSKDANKFFELFQNVPEFRNRISSSGSQSQASFSTVFTAPAPLQYNEKEKSKENATRGESRTKREHASRTPRIEISKVSLRDSGIGTETKSFIPSPMQQRESQKTPGSDSGCSNENQIKNEFTVNYQENNCIPNDMDSTEFEFLKQQNNENGADDTANLMDSLTLNDNLGSSRSSLYVPADFDETGDRLSEDFDADMRPASAIIQNKQFGTIRKAGWLVVKNVLIHSKKGKLEQASNRKWKKYWVALKGIELMFYDCDEKTVTSQDLDEPSHRLDIDKCIVQAVPEHAKLDDVFSLSTKHGNTYYLQSTNQVEVENWIHCVHSAAACAFARQKGKGGNVPKFLRTEIKSLENKIVEDEKLRKMAELQSKVVTDLRNKQTIVDQVTEWERSLENSNVDAYRFRCYLSAVEDTAVPNPQSLLRCVSRSVKHTLSKLGVFSVASFHAFVCVRETLTLNEPTNHKVDKPGKTKRKLRGTVGLKSKLLQSLRIVDDKIVEGIRSKHSPRERKKSSLTSTSDSGDNDSVRSNLKEGKEYGEKFGNLLQVQLPNNQTTMIPSDDGMTVFSVISTSCEKRKLVPSDHFLMLLTEDNDNGLVDYVIPPETDLLKDHKYTSIKICKKTIFDVELDNPADYDAGSFGLSLYQHSDKRILVSCVEEGSPAKKAMVLEGDELVKVNGEDIRGNYLADVENILDSSTSVSLQLLSSRIDDLKKTRQTTENLISFLVCPPPPKTSQSEINEDILDTLIVPSPMGNNDDDAKSMRSDISNNLAADNGDIDALLSRAEEVNIMTRQMNEIGGLEPRPVTKIKPGHRLRKIAVELLETERTYVKNLNILLERYLYALREESFLSKDEIENLVDNVSEIFDFQTSFLDNLEEIIRTDKGFHKYEEISEFQNVMYGVAETFLEYVDKLKLYSTFCSCHSRALKLLEPGKNLELQAFLEARNPKQQHSGTLESFLITPIQRILRYPLLMKEMLKLMNKDSDEYLCLTEALVSVEKVANYINEMQMISETYTPIFEKLCENVEGVDSSGMGVDNLLHYGKVRWLHESEKDAGGGTIRNSFTAIRGKKDSENDGTLFIFKKAVGLVVYESKGRKKGSSSSSSLKIKTTDEVKFQTLIPIKDVLIRDYAWSSNDTNHIWEIVDIDSQGTGQETPYMFVNRSAEEKRLFVVAIKEATKCSSEGLSPRSGPPTAAKPRIIKDKNNSNILPSRPSLEAGKGKSLENKGSSTSKANWNGRKARLNSDGDSLELTANNNILNRSSNMF